MKKKLPYLPSHVQEEHLELAARNIDQEGWPAPRSSKVWVCVYQGKRYPPKFFLMIAAKYADNPTFKYIKDETVLITDYYYDPGAANAFLEKRGCKIISLKKSIITTDKKFSSNSEMTENGAISIPEVQKASDVEGDNLLSEIKEGTLTIEKLERQLLNIEGNKHTDQIVKVRRFQAGFRALVIAAWQKCPFTGIDKIELLIASHIKPYSKCDDTKECCDKYNGIPLTPSYDRLFDRGYISFDEHGHLMISSQLKKLEIEYFNLENLKTTIKLGEMPQREKYLRYHRKKIFIK